jgi:hypothetical protein
MSKQEPAWKAELEKGLARALSGSGLNIAARVTARDAILPPVWAAIRAAEQRGFQAGVNKTGDSVGKLREQLKTARRDARHEAATEIRYQGGFSLAFSEHLRGMAAAADLIDPDKP